MEATRATQHEYADRRRRLRVVNRRDYTVQCKACGRRWRPTFNANGRVVRGGLRCPNPQCEFHNV